MRDRYGYAQITRLLLDWVSIEKGETHRMEERFTHVWCLRCVVRECELT